MGLLHRSIVIALVVGSIGAQAAQLTCEAQGQGRTSCPADLSAGAELVTQLSGAPCNEGSTWGTDHNGIWVAEGCRGVFKVAAAQANPASGQSAQWQRGFADGQRGAYDENSHPRDYRDGYKEGEQAALNADAAAQPSEQAGAGTMPDTDPAQREDLAPPAEDDQQRDEPPQAAGEDEEPRGEDDVPRGEDDVPRGDEDEGGYAMPAPEDRAQRACVEEAALGEAYRTDRVFVRDQRSIGGGLLEIRLETPDGPLVCTVDRAGRVQSMEEP